MIDRLGRVDDGTSTMDFEPEETKRQITISAGLNHCEWGNCNLHIIDTPGYTNFLHDSRNCLRVLSGVITSYSIHYTKLYEIQKLMGKIKRKI